MYESDTEHEPGLAGRIISVVAALTFAGASLWIGLSGEGADLAEDRPGATDKADREPVEIARLEIVEGPHLVRRGTSTFVEWRTNRPADSFAAAETSEAELETVGKSADLVESHGFELPDRPFLDLLRIQVRSASTEGEYVGAEIGPGGGGRWQTFADITAEHGARLLAPTGTLTWGAFDGDGLPDAAACDTGDTRIDMAVWATGAGEVVWRRSLAPAAGYHIVRWADLNGDGSQDIVLGGDRMAVYWNSGMPEPPLRKAEVVAQQPTEPFLALEAVDLDLDGRADVVGLLADGSLQSWICDRATGDLKAEDASPGPAPDASVRPALVVADFNGDGAPDVLSVAGECRLHNRVSQGFETSTNAFSGIAAIPEGVTWGCASDYDADGDVDLAMGDPDGGVVLLANNAVGGFIEATVGSHDLERLKADSTCGSWADMNADGRPDLVLGMKNGGLRLLMNGGRGEFLDGTSLADLPTDGPGAVLSIAMVDLDSDGQMDIHVTYEDGTFSLLRNQWRTR